MVEMKGENVEERLREYQALKYNKDNKFDVLPVI